MMVFKLCGGTGFIEEIEEDCANINSETELMRAAQRDDSETIAVSVGTSKPASLRV